MHRPRAGKELGLGECLGGVQEKQHSRQGAIYYSGPGKRHQWLDLGGGSRDSGLWLELRCMLETKLTLLAGVLGMRDWETGLLPAFWFESLEGWWCHLLSWGTGFGGKWVPFWTCKVWEICMPSGTVRQTVIYLCPNSEERSDQKKWLWEASTHIQYCCWIHGNRCDFLWGKHLGRSLFWGIKINNYGESFHSLGSSKLSPRLSEASDSIMMPQPEGRMTFTRCYQLILSVFLNPLWEIIPGTHPGVYYKEGVDDIVIYIPLQGINWHLMRRNPDLRSVLFGQT